MGARRTFPPRFSSTHLSVPSERNSVFDPVSSMDERDERYRLVRFFWSAASVNAVRRRPSRNSLRSSCFPDSERSIMLEATSSMLGNSLGFGAITMSLSRARKSSSSSTEGISSGITRAPGLMLRRLLCIERSRRLRSHVCLRVCLSSATSSTAVDVFLPSGATALPRSTFGASTCHPSSPMTRTGRGMIWL